jgi:DNA-binding MarR family transcriptional regulator
MRRRPEGRGDLGGQLSIAAAAVDRQVQSRLIRLGHGEVRPGHLALLLNLERGGGRGAELARLAGIKKQSMGELVRDLEASDYVERRSDPRDGRAQLILPTGRGLMLIAHVRQAVAEVEADAVRRLGPKRYGELRRALIELAEPESPPDPQEPPVGSGRPPAALPILTGTARR